MAAQASFGRHVAQLAYLDTQTAVPALARVAIAVAVVATRWDQRRRTRKHLGGLEPHILKDIGLTQDQATREARKSFWQY